MRTEIETNGLDRYLDSTSSERVVTALKRLICLGMQEVAPAEQNQCPRGKTWREEFFKIKCAIASDPAAAPALLYRLAQSYESDVLVRIAENTQADAHTLACLGTNPSADVRMAVAENTNTPMATLVALAFDESVDVRFHLAENHNLSPQILGLLAEDENPYVRWRAETTLDRLQPSSSGPVPYAA